MKRIIKYLVDISGFMIIAAMPCVVMYMLGHIGTNVIEQGYCDYGIRLILICYFLFLYQTRSFGVVIASGRNPYVPMFSGEGFRP